MSRADSHTPRSRHCVAAATSGSRPECSRVWSRKPSLATTGSWASRSTISRSTAVNTKHPRVVKAPARTAPIVAAQDGNGRSRPTPTASRWDGSPPPRTATTAPCSRRARRGRRTWTPRRCRHRAPRPRLRLRLRARRVRRTRHRACDPALSTAWARSTQTRRATRVALACRTDQLVVDELRSTPTQHRPSPRPPHCRTRTRDRSDHHRQARQMGQPLATPMSALLAHALSVGTPPSRLFVDKAVQLASSFVDNPPGRVPVCGSTVRCRTRTLGPCPRGWRRSSDGR